MMACSPKRAIFCPSRPPTFASLMPPVSELLLPTESRPEEGAAISVTMPGVSTKAFAGPRGSQRQGPVRDQRRAEGAAAELHIGSWRGLVAHLARFPPERTGVSPVYVDREAHARLSAFISTRRNWCITAHPHLSFALPPAAQLRRSVDTRYSGTDFPQSPGGFRPMWGAGCGAKAPPR